MWDKWEFFWHMAKASLHNDQGHNPVSENSDPRQLVVQGWCLGREEDDGVAKSTCALHSTFIEAFLDICPLSTWVLVANLPSSRPIWCFYPFISQLASPGSAREKTKCLRISDGVASAFSTPSRPARRANSRSTRTTRWSWSRWTMATGPTAPAGCEARTSGPMRRETFQGITRSTWASSLRFRLSLPSLCLAIAPVVPVVGSWTSRRCQHPDRALNTILSRSTLVVRVYVATVSSCWALLNILEKEKKRALMVPSWDELTVEFYRKIVLTSAIDTKNGWLVISFGF